jgi:Fe-S-cluster-containing dehydrogenase component
VKRWILEEIESCVGCHACEVACKQENNILEGNGPLQVVQVGPFIVGEEPVMEFVILINNDCTGCESRVREGSTPFCVSICPTDALRFLDTPNTLEEMNTGKKIQIITFFE